MAKPTAPTERMAHQRERLFGVVDVAAADQRGASRLARMHQDVVGRQPAALKTQPARAG